MSYLGENIPKLGFGLMRLPQLPDGKFDRVQTAEMVDMFLKAGFTYFDTAYGYNAGDSEATIREALVERYPRDSFQLATKLPAWAGAKTAEEARQMFYTSLERTGAGYFDFYLLHNMGGEHTKYFDDFGIWDFVSGLKEQGLVKHMGFSFHGTPEELEVLLTEHPEAEFVQLQINYADWDDPIIQSRRCYETARAFNKPVIIMEPVKGGSLANLPENLSRIFKEKNPDVSISSWAVRYAASLDGLITVLSGMSNTEQMADNLRTMSDFKPLTDAERGTIAEMVEAFKNCGGIKCTACSYCVKGCPAGISIPDVFAAMNQLLIFNNENGAKGDYRFATMKTAKASACVQCGQCESVCPQHLNIRQELQRIAEKFEK